MKSVCISLKPYGRTYGLGIGIITFPIMYIAVSMAELISFVPEVKCQQNICLILVLMRKSSRNQRGALLFLRRETLCLGPLDNRMAEYYHSNHSFMLKFPT